MTLADKMKSARKPKMRTEPLWKGPLEDGITQSLLQRYLCCKERFRVLAIEGLRPQDAFSHRLEYGDMWHVCEEAHAEGKDYENPLRALALELAKRYPLQAQQVEHWYNVCRVQFPVYVRYWESHPDVSGRKNVFSEEKFKVAYELPSGREVTLLGKWDSVDVVDKEVWLQENKAKGDLDEIAIKRQCKFDLQSMFYLVALYESDSETLQKMTKRGGKRFAGVRYNCVRRPLSSGKHSIRQHQPTKSNPAGESSADFYKRLGDLIREDADYFFMRWNVEINAADVQRFQRETLGPVLENLCDDHEWWCHCFSTGDNVFNSQVRAELFPDHGSYVFRYPYGIYNILQEGGYSDLDEFLDTGSEMGLERAETLFPELK